MALDSQVSNLESVSNLGGLVHTIFTSEVKDGVFAESPTAQLFEEAGPGDYRLDGSQLQGATDLTYSGGAMGTDGNLPDHQYADPANWQITPARCYIRRAVDNFTQARGQQGPGAYEDFLGRVFDQQWEAYRRFVIRTTIGDSDGTVCLFDTRSSSTVFTVKDGYGHTGTSPLMHLEAGMVIAWIDADSSNAVGGAGIISSIDYSADQVTMTSGSNWESNGTPATNDPIVTATTNDTTADYFASSWTRDPNGLMDIIDPDADATTVFNISQSTYPRWKPFREASSAFDHIELTEHWQKLEAKSTQPVTNQTHACVASPAVMAELARTLTGFQQQANLGQTFEGGYQAVRIAGMDFIKDTWQLHDVVYTVCREDIFNADLDGQADYFAEDGSQFSRLADYDGREWYVKHYFNRWSDRRNRHGALTGITLSNVTADDFSPTPDY